LAIARTSAAKPAALEARPAAVGKLFSETILRGREASAGREESFDSRAERRARSSRKQACVRAPDTSWGEEFRRRVSSFGKVEEQAAVVWVRRSAWERVTEMEELVGRFSFGSRFPQYLFSLERRRGGVEGYLLDDGDVYWRRSARLIDLRVCHFEDILLSRSEK
jgi:hypothetical protein